MNVSFSGDAAHQKWMNQGTFDGGLLTENQKKLQDRYSKILIEANARSSIRSGMFYDLHYYNRNTSFNGYSDKVYAFLRHDDQEVLLIVINFGEHEEEVNVKIPKDALHKTSLNTSRLHTKTLEQTFIPEIGIKFKINSLDYIIIEIN